MGICEKIYEVPRPVCFVFERARAPRHFLLGSRAPYGEFEHFYFKGTEAIAFVASVKYRLGLYEYHTKRHGLFVTLVFEGARAPRYFIFVKGTL